MKHLSKRFVVHVQSQLIDTFGGSHGVRDEGLLESALAQSSMTFGGVDLHTDIHEAAASYAFHLAKNHPFVDGNKRVAATAMGVFLRINGHEAKFEEVALYDAILSVIDGRWDKTKLAQWLRNVT